MRSSGVTDVPDSSELKAITTAIRREVPPQPGVYLFYNTSGLPIYIGKSVNLRHRMLSYFDSSNTRLEYRMRRMVHSIDRFDFRQTETELLALLLEDALIKRERPILNVRQQEFMGYCYIWLTNDPFPACRVANVPGEAGGRIFGPFHNSYTASDIITFINRHFRLRPCFGPRPTRRCLELDLGTCSGPCTSRVSVDEYSGLASLAVAFLEGDETWLGRRIRGEIAKCIADGRSEKAAGLEADLSFCSRFCARQRFTQKFKTGRLSVRERGAEDWTYLFSNGRLVDVRQHVHGGSESIPVPEVLLDCQTDDICLADRANVVYDWLNRNPDTCGPVRHWQDEPGSTPSVTKK